MLGDLAVLASALAPLGLMLALWVLAQISRRFGQVMGRPPLYRGFYVALTLLLPPLIVRLLAVGLAAPELRATGGSSVWALAHDLPLAAAVTLALAVAWRYWGWLVRGQEARGTPPRSRD
ncbi:MAG: hypothetical protein KJ047_09930 [Anaerolineae bacterium]|nr:hypothetical protein [Anaerolineae bacterium]